MKRGSRAPGLSSRLSVQKDSGCLGFRFVFSAFPLHMMMYFFALFFALGHAMTSTHPPLVTADIFGGRVLEASLVL
ncbi:MAG: hypothetical protein ACUVWO_07285 [Thermodesulfobacteriota bacterium]